MIPRYVVRGPGNSLREIDGEKWSHTVILTTMAHPGQPRTKRCLLAFGGPECPHGYRVEMSAGSAALSIVEKSVAASRQAAWGGEDAGS